MYEKISRDLPLLGERRLIYMTGSQDGHNHKQYTVVFKKGRNLCLNLSAKKFFL